VEPQAASQQHDGPGANSVAAAGQAGGRPAQHPLSEEESRVLECLQKAPSGLTAGQLESRSACSGPALEQALEHLIERKLVGRLNTIIPSYSARSVSPPIDGR
jgi:hypothetical protein